MPAKKTIALLFGGRSAEHEVSILSAAAVFDHLDRSRYDVVCVYIARDGRWKQVVSPRIPRPSPARPLPFLPALADAGPRSPLRADLYFPVLHGPYGEDGTIQGLLEMADVPYVGPGVLASAAGMDKDVMKQLFQARGLLVVPWIAFGELEWGPNRAAVLRRVRAAFGLPFFVKPANLGSSIGISKVRRHARSRRAVDLALRYDRKVLVEKGIAGREIECAVLGNDEPAASLPGEVFPANDFYDYRDKYIDGKTRFGIPADLPPDVAAEVRRQAVTAFQACGAEGLSRVDFFLEKGSGDLYVNEINTLPGFTAISMYPKLWGVTGIPYGKLLDRLIRLGFERHRREEAPHGPSMRILGVDYGDRHIGLAISDPSGPDRPAARHDPARGQRRRPEGGGPRDRPQATTSASSSSACPCAWTAARGRGRRRPGPSPPGWRRPPASRCASGTSA